MGRGGTWSSKEKAIGMNDILKDMLYCITLLAYLILFVIGTAIAIPTLMLADWLSEMLNE